MDHPNVQVLRHSDEAMERGDIEEFFSYYTDDVAVHVPGSNALAGDHVGKEKLQELFGRFMELIGEYSFTNLSYFADDRHGVILQRSKALRDGRTFEQEEAFIFRFRDGKMCEMWYVPLDQAAFDAWIG